VSLRLALWQDAGAPADPAATLERTQRAVDAAAAEGAGLLVFPEGYLTGYHRPGLSPGDLGWVEQALEDVGRMAERAGVAVVMGAHMAEGGALTNAAEVFSANGSRLGRYRKRALFGAWEKATFRPGGAPFLFQCGGLRVGVAICYDVEFPELVRAYARAGAQALVAPTALMAPHDRVARILVPARAMENRIFVGYANRVGEESGLRYVGLSRICGPDGRTLAEADAAEGLICATLEPAAIDAAKADGDYLTDLDLLGPRSPRTQD
jgi:predicted amidohydrolase